MTELEMEMLEALKAAELAEAFIICQWASFWDVVPQSVFDALMKAQAARNAVLAKVEDRGEV